MRILCLDVECSKKPAFLPWIPEATLYLISCYDGTSRRSWLFNHQDATQTPRDCIDQLQEEVNNSDIIIGHNIKFDMHWLTSIGIDLSRVRLHCTLIGEYMIRCHKRLDGLSLNDLADYYCLPRKIDRVKLMWDSGYDTHEIPSKLLIDYCEYDCILAWEIYQRQQVAIKELGLSKLIQLEMEAMRCTQEMEYRGMKVDVPMLERLKQETEDKIYELDLYLTSNLECDNIGSDDQLSAALFGGEITIGGVETVERVLKNGDVKCYERQCKVKKTIAGIGLQPADGTELKKGGVYSVSAENLALAKATTKFQKDIRNAILERAKLSTLLSTFYNGLLLRVGDDGIIHHSLQQTTTRTSRLSCQNPNAQNIPRVKDGPKTAFITRYAS